MTEQELETFFDEIGLFSEEKSVETKRELPKLPSPPITPVRKPRKWIAIWVGAGLLATFTLGLVLGLATAAISHEKLDEIHQQLTFLMQKVADAEQTMPASEVIEPHVDAPKKGLI
ncbi:MAG: hypothetical protein H7A36_04025 [Chlamydiales bacterium]|nr:hypothetical protein [Chlamydiales bacterium]